MRHLPCLLRLGGEARRPEGNINGKAGKGHDPPHISCLGATWWIGGDFRQDHQIPVRISESELPATVEIDLWPPLDTRLLLDLGMERDQFLDVEPKSGGDVRARARALVLSELQTQTISLENGELRCRPRP